MLEHCGMRERRGGVWKGGEREEGFLESINCFFEAGEENRQERTLFSIYPLIRELHAELAVQRGIKDEGKQTVVVRVVLRLGHC